MLFNMHAIESKICLKQYLMRARAYRTKQNKTIWNKTFVCNHCIRWKGTLEFCVHCLSFVAYEGQLVMGQLISSRGTCCGRDILVGWCENASCWCAHCMDSIMCNIFCVHCVDYLMCNMFCTPFTVCKHLTLLTTISLDLCPICVSGISQLTSD